MQLARVVWERDQHNGVPVMLPHALASKYPEYQFSWGWAWLFPAHNTCRDPRSGIIVRYRMHEVNVQRAIKHARRKLGISVLPHELRHAFASHSMERGVNPRAIQEVMGHTSLETTMGYMHAEALSVPSPLDALPIPLPGIPVLPTLSNTRMAVSDEGQKEATDSAWKARFPVPPTIPRPACPTLHDRDCRKSKNECFSIHPRRESRPPVPEQVTAGYGANGAVVAPNKHRPPKAFHRATPVNRFRFPGQTGRLYLGQSVTIAMNPGGRVIYQ
jgi:hypothetical protein